MNINQSENATKVFSFIAKIPRGKVSTYKAVAIACGLKSPRTVGRILHHNEAPEIYPCHRVIKSDGSVASGYAFGGPGKQQELLEKEGIVFSSNGKVDLSKYMF